MLHHLDQFLDSNPPVSSVRRLIKCSDSGARRRGSRATPRLPGVVGGTPRALLCQDVEANARHRPAVVAQDPYHLLLVELWHRCGGDLLIELLPHCGHVAGGTRAYRTSVVVMSPHLVQAFQMDRVPTVQYTDVHRRVK